ncbi:S-adenosyl-L-methionine-dependent methyltransferase [Cercophora newfieldiana]|uniref:S-adenosyl-L-methionine-dependent methyltransferase n=1 Tax=Cercophora newfieldiana TaxID=92897 RepID=A0AA39Y0H4_9PEZI|nr:S-adenosyl-L-methionine-dependent methyltransferase [Cercophora newfieldiana]
MTDNPTRFNAEALTWDTRPNVLLATSLAHTAYLSHLPPQPTLSTLSVLEIGCGTGLLSLRLAPSVRSLTAVDAADGMIAMLSHKLTAPESPAKETKNVRAVCALLTDPDDERIATDPVTGERIPRRRFDVVVSHLVLHHIPDLEGLFKTNFGPEARRFHPEAKMAEVERHGVERGEMRGLLEGAGFVDVRVETAFEMEKKVETVLGNGVLGETMVFPFLICLGRRPE